MFRNSHSCLWHGWAGPLDWVCQELTTFSGGSSEIQSHRPAPCNPPLAASGKDIGSGHPPGGVGRDLSPKAAGNKSPLRKETAFTCVFPTEKSDQA